MPNGCCQRFPSKGCFDRKLRGFEEDTVTKFIVWTKDKAFGVDDPKPVSKKIKWRLQYVPFDGIPFMVVGRRVYSCHQGVDKHKHEKLTRQLQLLDDHSDHCYEERRRLQDSKKLDCPARIYVVHLIRFPDYKIPDDIHKQRKKTAGRLRCALTKNPSAVKLEEQYVACFPRIEEHKNHPVLGEHSVDGRPTPAHSDPLPELTYDHSNLTPERRPPKLRTVSVPPKKRLRVDSKPDNAENIRCDLQGVSMDITGEMTTESFMEYTTTEESTMVTKMECTDDQLQIKETQEELERLKTLLAQKEKENDLLREKIQTHLARYPLTPETINNSSVPNYFKYCTGFTYNEFNNLCRFFRLPDNETVPQTHILLKYDQLNRHIRHMPFHQQFLLVLMKLKQNFDLKELAFKFQIDVQSVNNLFSSWIDFMYDRLGNLSVWPHRDDITENMPDNYKAGFPTTFAILDCTELKIEKPNSLLVQSQTYSNYKSTNTLKSLIACDPRGSIMFASTLYTGSISDQELFRQCKIKDLLKGLLQCGYLKRGDGLMVDKGFLIEKDVKELGLKLNIPPFAKSNLQMPVPDVQITKKIAKHRVHIERATARVKNFKIVSGRIPNSTLGNINQIWFVVCMLSNFQQHIIQA